MKVRFDVWSAARALTGDYRFGIYSCRPIFVMRTSRKWSAL